MASTFINGTSAYAYLTIGNTRVEPGSIAVDPGLSIVQTLCGEESYGIGGFASSQLTVSVARSALPDVVPGQEITVYMGFVTGGTEDEPTYSTVPVGKFYATPDKVVTKGIFTTITAYDASYYATGQYLAASTPATVGALVADVIDQAGITLASDAYSGVVRPISTPVRDDMIGLTYREVIAHCALLLGANACMTRDGKLKFITLATSPVKTYGPGDYIYENYSLQSNAAYVMGRLEVQYPHEVTTGAGTEDQETEEVIDTYVYQASGTASERGIQLTTTEIRSQAETNSLGSALFGTNGLEVYGYSLGVGGRPEIDLGDMITLEDDFGVTMNLYILSHQITFNGAMSSVFAANVPENDTSTFDSTSRPTLSEQVQQLTGLSVRINRVVADLIESTNARFDKVVTRVLESDELKTGVAEIADARIESATIKDAQIESINGNKIQSGTVLAAALSNSAVQTLSGNKVYYQADQPEGTFKIGDTWYKTVVPTGYTGKILFVWDGTQWVDKDLDAKLLTAGSVSALEINTDSLAASSAFVGKLETEFERVGAVDGRHIRITDSAVEVMDGSTSPATKLAEFGDEVNLYDADGKAVVSLSTDANRIGGFDIMPAANGMDYLKSDYTLEDSLSTYRTWIRSAQETDKGSTWVFSAQRQRGTDETFRGMWYVQANGYMSGINHRHGIISRYSTDLINYTLFDDGFLEMDIFHEFTNVNCTTAAFSGYLSPDQTFAYPYSAVFLTQPRVICSMNGSSGAGYCMHCRTIGSLTQITTNFANTTKNVKPLVRATYHVAGFISLPDWYNELLSEDDPVAMTLASDIGNYIRVMENDMPMAAPIENLPTQEA